MISMEGVTKVYQTERIETLALDSISLTVEAGEFVSIMGPSGCGKSTLLNLMGLLDEPSKGSVTLDGRPVTRLKDRDLARLRNNAIGFIFQSFHLVADLTVLDNVEIPLLYRPGCSSRDRRKLAMAAIDRVGLASRARHYPGQLSGGQQQRAAIARAIAGRPRLVLADEPTGNLDSHMGDEILAILHDLNRSEKATVVMVTHDPRLADTTGRTIRLFDGRQVQ